MTTELEVLRKYGWSDELIAEFERGIATLGQRVLGASQSLVIGVDPTGRLDTAVVQPVDTAGSTILANVDARLVAK